MENPNEQIGYEGALGQDWDISVNAGPTSVTSDLMHTGWTTVPFDMDISVSDRSIDIVAFREAHLRNGRRTQ